MVEQSGAALPSERDGEQRRARPAPRTWIYRNLTPWRIYARYGEDGTPPLDGRSLEDVDTSLVRRVLSIPALGEVRLSNEDAEHLDTVGLRRRGQLDVRPAPSEFWSALPSLIVSLGLLAVVLVFGGLGAALRRLERGAVGVVRGIARRRPGRRPRGGDVPGDPHVSALRPLQEALLRAGGERRQGAIARGHRTRQPFLHVRRQPAAPGARGRRADRRRRDRRRRARRGDPPDDAAQRAPADLLSSAARVRRPVRRRSPTWRLGAQPSPSCSSATSPSGSSCRSLR